MIHGQVPNYGAFPPERSRASGGFSSHRWFVCSGEVGSEKPDPWIFVETHRQAPLGIGGKKGGLI
jgi:hypothetical protein